MSERKRDETKTFKYFVLIIHHTILLYVNIVSTINLICRL